jgi:hypothetical protein
MLWRKVPVDQLLTSMPSVATRRCRKRTGCFAGPFSQENPRSGSPADVVTVGLLTVRKNELVRAVLGSDHNFIYFLLKFYERSE